MKSNDALILQPYGGWGLLLSSGVEIKANIFVTGQGPIDLCYLTIFYVYCTAPSTFVHLRTVCNFINGKVLWLFSCFKSVMKFTTCTVC